MVTITINSIPRPYIKITGVLSGWNNNDEVLNYQWKTSETSTGTYNTVEEGESASSYTIKYIDQGNYLKVFLTYVDNSTTYTISSDAVLIENLPELSTVTIDSNVNISNLKKGSLLRVSNLTYTLDPYVTVGYSYQWYKSENGRTDFVKLYYTDKATYTLTENDYNCRFKCSVNAYGGASGTVDSNIIQVPSERTLSTTLFKKQIKEPIFNLQCKISFLNPDQTLQREITPDILDLSGEINTSFSDGIRRTINLKLDNQNNKYDIDVNKMWLGQMFKVEMGMVVDDVTIYYPQGVYYIKKPTITNTPNSRYIQIQAVDKWGFLNGNVFGNLDATYKTMKSSNIYDATRQLLKFDRGNGMPLDYQEPILTSYYVGKYYVTDGVRYYYLNAPYDSEIDCTKTFADILLDYKKMLVGIIYYDASGHLTIEAAQEDIMDTTKEILWYFNNGDAELMEDKVSYNFEKLYNDIVIWGNTVTGHTATARVSNTNPKSDTNIYIVGRKTKTYDDKNYYSDEQCLALAKYYLKRTTILQKSINMSCTPMYHLDVNKLVDIQLPQDSKSQRYLINSIKTPLAPSQKMELNVVSVSDLDFTGYQTEV